MHDWIEVFKAGTWTPSDGQARTYSLADLDRIVEATRANFGVTGREVPIVIGHPESTAPAYGWVNEIQRVGGSLFVKLRDLVPEFVELVRKQMFPNRSIGIRADYSLDHIGFLGARRPAVAGLAPIAMALEATTAVITFTNEEERAMPDTKTRMQKLLEFLGLARELEIELPESALGRPAAPAPAATTFTQADLDAAAEKARTEATATAAKASALAARKASIVTFCEGLKQKGQLLPAWEAAGLPTFMEQLAAIETVVEFTTGTEKVTPLAWFQAHLAALPKVINFEELARAEKQKPATLSSVQRDVNRQLGVPDDVVAKFAASNN